MQRITTSTRSVDLFGVGRHGFRDGNLAIGLAPTDLNADWFNQVQEEIAAVIEAAGLTLSGANRAQLLEAINLRAGVPAGAVMGFARTTPPTGWLRANGAAVSRTTYAGLFASIGTTFGAGDGSTTFTLPDLRGEFIRGLDDGRGVDTGRVLGAAQADETRSHTHTSAVANTNVAGSAGVLVAGSAVAGSWPTSATGGSETRPRNQALLFCIKF